jgi:hypothetical protein
MHLEMLHETHLASHPVILHDLLLNLRETFLL